MTEHTAPQRVQLRRTRGWRLPGNTVVVSRPTRWGNPFRAADFPRADLAVMPELPVVAFAQFVRDRDHTPGIAYPSNEEVRAELAGRHLACWCPLSVPCHADVLLALANAPVCGVCATPVVGPVASGADGAYRHPECAGGGGAG